MGHGSQSGSFPHWKIKRPFPQSRIDNNQIYKTLVKLLENGFVTNEIQSQENAP